MKNKKRRVLPVAIALMAVVALSGVAYAYWSSSGDGTGTAGVAADSMALTVEQTNKLAMTPLFQEEAQRLTSLLRTVRRSAVIQRSRDRGGRGKPSGWLRRCLVQFHPTGTRADHPRCAGGANDSVDLDGSITMSDSATEDQSLCKNADPVLDLSVS